MAGYSYRRGEARDHFWQHLMTVTDECKVWPYTRDERGYGRVTAVRNEGQRAVHVMACEAWNGPRPQGHIAIHGPCHNPSCWNGAHLSWGTHQQNQMDRLRDGTSNRGVANGRAVLTADVVLAVRTAALTNTQRSVAAQFGISQAQVSRIVNRHEWGWL